MMTVGSCYPGPAVLVNGTGSTNLASMVPVPRSSSVPSSPRVERPAGLRSQGRGMLRAGWVFVPILGGAVNLD